MISHNYKCIFLHIPKCGGTSIEYALGHHGERILNGGQDHRSLRMIEKPFITPNLFSSKQNVKEALRRIKYKTKKQSNYNNKLIVNKTQFNSYYKFTFVRNPWSRAFSAYKNVLNDKTHWKDYNMVTKDLTLKDFLKIYAGRLMLRPQTYWIESFDGSINLDYIGRFETLNEDCKNIFNDLNIPFDVLPHKIKGSGENYVDYYDEESIDFISKVYKKEIEYFNYSFNK